MKKLIKKHPKFEIKPEIELSEPQKRLVKAVEEMFVDMGNHQYFLPFQRGLRGGGKIQKITSI